MVVNAVAKGSLVHILSRQLIARSFIVLHRPDARGGRGADYGGIFLRSAGLWIETSAKRRRSLVR